MAPPRNQRQRPGFSRRAQYTLFLSYVIAAGGAVVGAVLLVISTLNPPLFAAMRSAVSEVTTPIASGLHTARRWIIDLPGGFGDYFGVVGQNRHMRRQLDDQRELVLRARTLSIENQRLRGLLKVRDATGDVVTTARIVSSTASSTRRFGTLNAGRFQGIRPGMPVRGPEGLIGRVVETGPNTARVLLLTDPESLIPVRRTRDGAPAVIAGRGDGLVDVRSAGAADLAFAAGDAFVTSGAGGIFPPNVPVARVIAAGRDSVQARVFANPDSLDFAVVQPPFLPPLPPPPEAGR